MTIIADQPVKAELDKQTVETIDAIRAAIAGFARIAGFLEANPDLPSAPSLYPERVLVCLNSLTDPKAALALWMARAIEAGALVEAPSDSKYAGVELHFGPVHIYVYANRELLGERVRVVEEHWQLSVEIPAHARREQAEVTV
ncbi:hypothetical protein [Nonomuraea dietziae]|uniref:hypothetical protein n=1 Tax=Nonomuraea dietziae TaxID=65515 RepID=UPI0033E50089